MQTCFHPLRRWEGRHLTLFLDYSKASSIWLLYKWFWNILDVNISSRPSKKGKEREKTCWTTYAKQRSTHSNVPISWWQTVLLSNWLHWLLFALILHLPNQGLGWCWCLNHQNVRPAAGRKESNSSGSSRVMPACISTCSLYFFPPPLARLVMKHSQSPDYLLIALPWFLRHHWLGSSIFWYELPLPGTSKSFHLSSNKWVQIIILRNSCKHCRFATCIWFIKTLT